MIRRLETLTEREKKMKKLFQGEGREFLSTPMSFAEYKKLIQEHPGYPNVGSAYELGSTEQLGTTIPEVEALTDGEAIDIEVHERYGYPVVHNHVYIEMIYVYSGICTHFIESEARKRPRTSPKSADSRKLGTTRESADGRKPGTTRESADSRKPGTTRESADGRKPGTDKKQEAGTQPGIYQDPGDDSEWNRFQMKEGDLCFLAPNVRHVITALKDDVIVLNVLLSKQMIDTGFLALLKEKYLLADFFKNVLYEKGASAYILFPTGTDPWMKQTFGRLYREEQEKEYAYREYLVLYVKQVMIHLIRRYQLQAVVAESVQQETDNHVVAILAYISVNYNQTTLKQTAEFFHFSEAHLSRMLKKYTSRTFVQIITELQMKHGKELIEEGKLNLAQISQKVGCFDSSHFSKKFKKQFGMAPEEYRKKICASPD